MLPTRPLHSTLIAMALLVPMLAPLDAQAQQAQTLKWSNLRAGPAREYPLVAQLPPATPVAVQGCIDGFRWCDVVTPDNLRGWVYGGNLVYPYQGSNVTVIQAGPNIGLPIVTFILGAYWGSHYLQRPWYSDRRRWDDWSHQRNRPPAYRPPPLTYRPDFRPPRPPGVGGDGRVRPPPRPPVTRSPAPPRPPVSTRPPVQRPAPDVRPGPRPGQPTRPVRPDRSDHNDRSKRPTPVTRGNDSR